MDIKIVFSIYDMVSNFPKFLWVPDCPLVSIVRKKIGVELSVHHRERLGIINKDKNLEYSRI